MKRDIKVYLEDIVESISHIEDYIKNASSTTFEKDIKLQDAVIRRIEIIGEAVKHIPQDIKNANPQIPWKDAAATRDVFTHDYFGITPERVWNTITNDLPSIKKDVEELLKTLA